jgi:hypoxanthine phosphoribosyltransferase
MNETEAALRRLKDLDLLARNHDIFASAAHAGPLSAFLGFRFRIQYYLSITVLPGPVMQVLLSTERIQKRVAELAGQIAQDYRHRPATIVGVLTGSLMFLADLVRHLDLPLRIGLIQASSYRGMATSPGELHIHPELLPDVRGRHVLLLDDILDTGQTLAYLLEHLRGLGTASLHSAVLLRKLGRQKVPVQPDYIGFDIPDAFVVGYGLDYNDEYRHLPYIAVLPSSTQGAGSLGTIGASER